MTSPTGLSQLCTASGYQVGTQPGFRHGLGGFSLCCFSSTRTAVTSSLLPEGTPTSSPCRALQHIYSALSRGCAAVGEGTHLLLCRDSDHPWNLKSLDFCKPRFPGILCSRCRVSMWWAWTSLVENRCGPGREESLGKALRWPATGWHRTIRLKKAAGTVSVAASGSEQDVPHSTGPTRSPQRPGQVQA